VPNLTLIDWSKRVDPDGSTPVIANLLEQTNAVLKDAIYVQGNLPTGHRVTVATGLPTVYYRALNQGIPTSKASTTQVDESCAILEARSEVDIDLAMLNGNTAEFRLSEARLFIEGMNQTMATGFFYGNPSVDPKQFLGLAPRYSSLSAGNAQNIINAQAASPTANQQTSVWLICWSDQTVFCMYPKGSKAGLLQEDLGRQTSYQAATSDTIASGALPTLRLEVLAERFQWKTGLVVKDWRYAVRIANVEVGGATSAIENLSGVYATTVVTNIIHRMAQAIARIPNTSMGKCVFYMNRTVFTALMRTAMEKGASSGLTVQTAATQFGTPSAMLSFLGIPIRQCDSILNTEAVVS
jgi:hypothetical protein